MLGPKTSPSNAFSNGGSIREWNGFLYLLTDILEEGMQELLISNPGVFKRKFEDKTGLLIGRVPGGSQDMVSSKLRQT